MLVPPCSHCREEVPEGGRFCPHCGAAVAVPPPAPEPTPAMPPVMAGPALGAGAAAALGAGLVRPIAAPVIAEVPRSQAAPDPFSHTAPANPDELARLSDMIAARNASDAATEGAGAASAPATTPGVSVRERQFGSTKALEAAPELRPAGASAGGAESRGVSKGRDRTLESPAAPPPRVPPPPSRPPLAAASPPAPEVRLPAAPAQPGYAAQGGGLPAPPQSPAPPAISPRAATTAQPSMQLVGQAVKVLWSDGQPYPATVMQVTPTHCSVRFTNGAVQWIENRFIVV